MCQNSARALFRMCLHMSADCKSSNRTNVYAPYHANYQTVSMDCALQSRRGAWDCYTLTIAHDWGLCFREPWPVQKISNHIVGISTITVNVMSFLLRAFQSVFQQYKWVNIIGILSWFFIMQFALQRLNKRFSLLIIISLAKSVTMNMRDEGEDGETPFSIYLFYSFPFIYYRTNICWQFEWSTSDTKILTYWLCLCCAPF